MSLRDEWGTPPELFAVLNREFDFNLDVCASDANALCRDYFTGPCGPNEGGVCMCGLCRSWAGTRAFMNPPYSAPSTWCLKALNESRKGKTLVVALLPAATSEHWYHTMVFEAAHEVRLIRGRLKYTPPPGVKASSNKFGSAIAIYRPGPAPLRGADIYPWDWKRG